MNLKVLHIASGVKFCGISTYTTNLIKHFEVNQNATHERINLLTNLDFESMSKKSVFEYFRDLSRKTKKYDVIHIQNEFGLFGGAHGLDFAMKVFYLFLKSITKHKRKIIVTYHSEPTFMKGLGLMNFENKRCAKWFRKTAKLHTTENNVKALLHTKTTEKSYWANGFRNVCNIRHGVLERWLTPNYKIKAKEDPVVLGMFGFLSDYKGHEFALSILDLLPSNFKLYIVGGRHRNSGGEEIGNILNKANALGLSDRILITGWIPAEDADKHQKMCDISILPYQTTELSASGAATWALTSGRPVIASNTPAFKELNEAIEDKEPMMLCHMTERTEWVWAIKKILNEPKLKHMLIDNCREYCDTFSWTNVCKQHIELYKQ